MEAQDVTSIEGRVFAKDTKEPLAFVNISYIGTSVGTSSDLDGKFKLDTRFPSDTLLIDYIGYRDLKVLIKAGTRDKRDFYLEPEGLKLDVVSITADKGKYSKKNNPSLELMKKVLANKGQNHLKAEEYYSFSQYDKVRLDINNITDKFKNRRFIRDFDFLWDFIDTSDVNGRTYLPVFIREISSTKYHKKKGNINREYRHGINYSKVNDQVDANSLNDIIDLLYTDVDIYEDEIQLIENNFVSPISSNGVNFYRYYIQDTTYINGKSAINLAFIPEDKGDMGFTGNLYISNDDRYSILKVEMGIINGINLNFVRDLSIEQEFKEYDGKFLITKDEVVIDYSLSKNGIGFFGNRSLHRSNFSFEKPDDPNIFNGTEEIIVSSQGLEQSAEFWNVNRLAPLAKSDLELYQMMDILRHNRRYQTYITLLNIATTGYIPLKYFEIGKVANFANYNQVEAWTLRFGISTKFKFSKKLRLIGDISYATQTENVKWFGRAIYSFNKDWFQSPKHQFSISAEEASSFPGQELENFNPENIFLSFRRGEATRMLLTRRLEFSYLRESDRSPFSIEIGARFRDREAIGTLSFERYSESMEDLVNIESIRTSEPFLRFRYAPNEQFLQGKDARVQLQNEFPIITLQYARGISGLFGGEYDYHKLYATLFKQIEWTELGTTNFNIEAGKLWGNIPYILRWLPRGNQTYIYQLTSYNLMNFLEFSADQFASFQMEHYFYGYFMNNIPLLKHLKLREIVALKAYYGSTRDSNNPDVDQGLVQFPIDGEGNQRTFAFDGKPYVEASLGFSNILKFLRLDLIKRFTYLDNPDVPSLWGQKGLAVRARAQVEF